jgi:hypothetical protein
MKTLAIWVLSILAYLIMIFVTYGYVWERRCREQTDDQHLGAVCSGLFWPLYWVARGTGKIVVWGGDVGRGLWVPLPAEKRP